MIKHYGADLAIDEVISKIMTDEPVRVKAGTWQADDTHKDLYMRVLYNHFFSVPIPLTAAVLAEQTKCDLPWAEDHFQERIGGNPTNPGDTYKYWPYKTFTEEDEYMDGKKFSHTYQERFWPKQANFSNNQDDNQGIRYDLGDLNDVVRQLHDNPLTRQAYLPIFFPEDTGAVHGQRVPCTLGYYFWIQDDKLHCNYMIRSCDIFRHFRNDVYLTGRLMQHIASELTLKMGNLNFMAFNLHLFENDIYPLKQRKKKNA